MHEKMCLMKCLKTVTLKGKLEGISIFFLQCIMFLNDSSNLEEFHCLKGKDPSLSLTPVRPHKALHQKLSFISRYGHTDHGYIWESFVKHYDVFQT